MNPEDADNGGSSAAESARTGQRKRPRNRSGEKWTLRRHWRAASRRTKLSWMGAGLGLFLAAIGTIATIWKNVQSGQQFKAEHRPRVIFSRPPEIHSFTCEFTGKVLHHGSGPAPIWVKNVEKGHVAGAFVSAPSFKFIPVQKTGDAYIDEPLSITEKECGFPMDRRWKFFPINGGEEKFVSVNQSVGAIGMSHPALKPDTRFQLFATYCVYYVEDDNTQHGTCTTYRLLHDGQYDFVCNKSTFSGTFDQTMFGYCET